jgi:hypothetical protein
MAVADQVHISTGGVERVEFGTTTIFNETGADVDFRIEGSSDANLFYVNAGSNRIGIGEASPDDKVHVTTTSGDCILQLEAAVNAGIRFSDSSAQRGLIYVDSSDTMNFMTGTSGVDMVMDSSGNVGIGTSSPASILHIYETTSNAPAIITLGNDEGTCQILTDNYSSGAGDIAFVADSDSSSTVDMIIRGDTGNVGIGTTSPASHFTAAKAKNGEFLVKFDNSGTTPSGINLDFSAASDDNNTTQFLLCQDSTTSRCIIYSDGDVWTSDAGTLTSDKRLKTNIQDATPKLDDLMKIKIKNFEWSEDFHPGKTGQKKIGVIAQEFEEIFPGLVSEHNISKTDNEPVMRKAVRMGALIPILVKGMQEQQSIIEDLKARIETLESR